MYTNNIKQLSRKQNLIKALASRPVRDVLKEIFTIACGLIATMVVFWAFVVGGKPLLILFLLLLAATMLYHWK